MKILFFILTAFFALARSQQNPTVTMYPEFKQVFSGDTLVLTCSGSGQLKWLFNNNPNKDQTRETWTINVISKNDSGSYQCERNGEKSAPKDVTVLDDLPVASLSIKSGRAVINRGDSVVLELHVDTGLLNWHCRVYKGGRVKKIGFNKTLMTSDKKDVQFHPKTLEDNESPAIFWCQHKTEMKRSNPITIKTTGRMVMLETPPEPAILGKQLTIWCRVWGEPDISNSFFLKNNKERLDAINSSLTIQNVKIEDQGNYSCTATYKFKKNTSNIPNTVTSDPQELLVIAQPPEAVFIESGTNLKCSCPKCSKPHSYRWYKQKQGQMEIVDQEVIDFSPSEVGSYWCKAVWIDRVSAPSAQFSVKLVPSGHAPVMLIVILFVCVILMVSCCVIAVFYMKKRRSSAAFREDGGYEEVGQRKATDNIMMQEKKKEGEYEALKQSEKEGEYHTLGAEGGKGTEAGYEALKRSKMDEKEGEYQTLGAEGGKGAEGGYEALKRAKMDEKEGEYQTLGAEGGKGAEGGYEALKRAKMDEKEGEYQTLGAEGGKGGEEILKKNND
ncbi:titin-like isoform X2 [Anguilla anguilla]|uniref:titin-like isoform X2 n=1 Tax=Anguilla anguilla TaxID=7936 RepID=UPI0015AE1E81|nr:titin-like isoform X2 [Anguilla anguilla]